jgi:hypothetical protein
MARSGYVDRPELGEMITGAWGSWGPVEPLKIISIQIQQSRAAASTLSCLYYLVLGHHRAQALVYDAYYPDTEP